MNAILDGPHHGHGTDADRQRGRDKAFHKHGVLGVSAFDLQPFSEAFKPAFDIDQLSDQAAQHDADDDEHRTTVILHHLLKRAGHADEQHRDTAGTVQRLLHTR